jgi:CBS domain containing-hemolysin-like protein
MTMDLVQLELWILGACLVLSAFFSAAETTLTTLSAFKVRQIVEQHPRTGRALRLWETNHASVLATILIGNTVVNVTAGSLATDLATQFYSMTTGVPLAIGGVTILLLVVGEIFPKTLARAYADQLAIPMTIALAGFYYLCFPVTWFITLLIRLAISVVGGRLKNGPDVTVEDIDYIISQGQRQGAIDKDEQEMLRSVIEFTDTHVGEIMVPRTEVVALPLDSSYEDVVRICAESGFSRLPVYEGTIDKVVGIFIARHLIRPNRPEDRDAFLRVRLRPAVFVPASKPISELLRELKQKRMHLAIVVNEFGGTQGIVTLEDIIEELLGEINDEFDEVEPLIKARPEGGFVADARIAIGDLEEALQIQFPEDRSYESLGGFLMEAAQDVPRTGWRHRFSGFEFTVLSADANRVNKVQILPHEPADEDEPSSADAA